MADDAAAHRPTRVAADRLRDRVVESRWWFVVFYGAVVVTAIVVWLEQGGQVRAAGVTVWVTLAILATAFPLLGVPGFTDLRRGIPFAALLVVALGVGTASEPDFLVFQAVAFPVLWCIFDSPAAAIAATGVAAGAGGFGFAAGLGFPANAVAQAVVIQVISMAFNVTMGLWVSHVTAIGAERARLLEQLRATQGELQTLHRDAGAAGERERIARELHDTIAQSLTSIVMLAQRARREDAPAVGDAIELIETTAREALGETRSLVAATARVPSDGSPLAESFARLAERFRRETAVDVRVRVGPVTVPRDLEVVLLRCAQEGLANVRKHAQAATASVGLEQQPDSVVLTIVDDGVGPGAYRPEQEHGFGLNGMRDRVGLVGGTVEFTAAEGRGAVLHVRLPIQTAEGTA